VVSETLVDLRNCALVPGPAKLQEPAYSFAVDELEMYDPAEVAAALLAVPGVKTVNNGARIGRVAGSLAEREQGNRSGFLSHGD
jgi:hypothetical protein